MTTAELSWEITPTEQRARKSKKYLALFPLLFLFLLYVEFQAILSPDEYCTKGYLNCLIDNILITKWIIIGTILIPLIILLIMFLLNKVNPYPTRKYLLADNFLQITNGSKSKTYKWEDFSAFYTYTFTRVEKIDPSSNIQIKVVELEKQYREIGGEKFLLKTKSRPLGFIKRFVVIYAEPDNSDQVKQFLEEHIPFEKLGVYTIEGLTIMEFQ